MAHGEATAEEEGEEAMEEGRRRTHQPDLTQQKSGGKAAMFMSFAGMVLVVDGSSTGREEVV
jgi:hypothetical protein